MIKALILDLDNTIFSTKSIDAKILNSFFNVLEVNNDRLTIKELEKAKAELWSSTFYAVAKKYGFSKKMIKHGFNALNKLTSRLDIQPFEDYNYVKEFQIDKYLVTTGITSVQKNKIKSLGIENDFIEIVIDDPFMSDGGKSVVFKELIDKYNLIPQDILVVGDNPESEIASAKKNKIPTVLIDRESKYGDGIADYTISTFKELLSILDN